MAGASSSSPNAKPVAEALDAALEDSASVPSAHALREMELRHRNTLNRFVFAQSIAHQGALLGLPLPVDVW